MDVMLTRLMGKPGIAVPLERVGGGYGGFWIPGDLLKSGGGLLTSGGIGFDVNLERAFALGGWEVIALDPLEECVAFARRELEGTRTHVLHSGLWSREGRVVFYAPRVKTHDSWSAVNIQETPVDEAKEFDVVSLAAIARRYPSVVRLRPAVLKLNIEGAEAEVLRHLSDSPIRFDVIAVHLESVSQVRLRAPARFLRESVRAVSLMRRLRSAGYRVARSRNLQMCLVHEDFTSLALRAPHAA